FISLSSTSRIFGITSTFLMRGREGPAVCRATSVDELPKANHLHRALPLHGNDVPGFTPAAVCYLLPSIAAQRYQAGHPVALHPRCRVDCVAPQVKEVLSMAKDTGDNRAAVDANAHIPLRLQALGRSNHLQAAAHAAQHRVLDASEQPGG